MKRGELQQLADSTMHELSVEAMYWRGPSRVRLQRAHQQLGIVWAAIPRATERELRAAEALLDAALDTLVRHAVARLELELENNR